jgi:hypothetical protein
MATVINEADPRAEAFRNLGAGALQSHYTRSDEMAIKNALEKLGQNPTARQVLDAVTSTPTYSPQAKQQALENFLGVDKFEEIKKAARKKENQEKLEFEETKRRNLATEAIADKNIVAKAQNIATTAKKEEKVNNIKSGIQTLKEMKDIGAKGNLGIGTGVRKVFSGEAAKDAAQYEQLGKSLIQLSTNIPIRNRQEFETLAHNLYDPSLRDSAREGILNALESILTRSLQAEESGEESQQKPSEGKVRVKNKQTGQTGSVTPYEGMDEKYDRI